MKELKEFDYTQLSSPTPIMSAVPAPPTGPDAFWSGQHLTRNLGSSTWETDSSVSSLHPQRFVIQLTEEEDQAITTLLTLHYEEVKMSTQPTEDSCTEEPLYMDSVDCPSMTPDPYIADEAN